MRPERPAGSLSLAVLAEEAGALALDFERIEALTDIGERTARAADLMRALDRYLRLEDEVFLPVLVRTGFDASAVRESQAQVRAVMAQTRSRQTADGFARLRAAFEAHARQQRERAFPAASRLPEAEQEALAYELDEVRNRMRGAYGV